jgi:hypothetical protein
MLGLRVLAIDSEYVKDHPDRCTNCSVEQYCLHQLHSDKPCYCASQVALLRFAETVPITKTLAYQKLAMHLRKAQTAVAWVVCEKHKEVYREYIQKIEREVTPLRRMRDALPKPSRKHMSHWRSESVIFHDLITELSDQNCEGEPELQCYCHKMEQTPQSKQ